MIPKLNASIFICCGECKQKCKHIKEALGLEKEFKINNKINIVSENSDKISVLSYVLNQKWLYGKENGNWGVGYRFKV